MDQPVRDLPIGALPPGLTRVPYWVYRDPEVARDEQARVFEGPCWHFLCLEIDLPETGDYRTSMMGAMPVVVARTEHGEIVAFENRCAHRGALICLDDGGTVKDFQCVYHAWRYDLWQPDLGCVPPRGQRQGWHAGRLHAGSTRPTQ